MKRNPQIIIAVTILALVGVFAVVKLNVSGPVEIKLDVVEAKIIPEAKPEIKPISETVVLDDIEPKKTAVEVELNSIAKFYPELLKLFAVLEKEQAYFTQTLQNRDAKQLHRFAVTNASNIEQLKEQLYVVLPIAELPLRKSKKQLKVLSFSLKNHLSQLYNERVSQACAPINEAEKKWLSLAENYAMGMPEKQQFSLKTYQNLMQKNRPYQTRIQACDDVIRLYQQLVANSASLVEVVNLVTAQQQRFVAIGSEQSLTQADTAEIFIQQGKTEALAGKYPPAILFYHQAIAAYNIAFQEKMIALATPKMIALQADEFLMGDTEGGGHEDEYPVHKEKIMSFSLGVTEVTVEQYQAYLFYKGDLKIENINKAKHQFPITDVSYPEALDFIQWLSEKTGETYRLPTEAQWEYAAKLESTSTVAPQKAHCEGCSKWGNKSAQAVKSLAATMGGFHDLYGNVWEWVEGCYKPEYQTKKPAITQDCKQHMVRGSSWADMPDMLRASNRSPIAGDTQSDRIGFRLAKYERPRD
ncbi:MAG: SUMF1/EgtB/PvdO family nonheme iron enzyme [Pseudomonadales bacterium]|nr:SUMF1/EgtB/PvdO family nonheme iron enzyme [Pseudomonadales bacterium]